MKIQGHGGATYEFPDDAKDQEILDFLDTLPGEYTPPAKASDISLSPYEQARLKGPMQPMAPYGTVEPTEILALPQVLGIPGALLEPIAGAAEDMVSDFYRRTGIDPSAQPGVPTFNIPRIDLGPILPPGMRDVLQIMAPEGLAGAEKKLGEKVSGFTTPGQTLLLPAMALGSMEKMAAQKIGAELGPMAKTGEALQALYAGSAAGAVPEALAQIPEAKTPGEVGEAIAGAGADIGMAYLMGRPLLKGPKTYARGIPKATEVHGDVRPPPIPGKGEMPSEGGSARVQPETKAVAEAPQVPLEPKTEAAKPPEVDPAEAAERAAIDAGTQSNLNLGLPAEVVESAPTSPDAPFARELATVDAQGRIVINRPKIREWLSQIPTEFRERAIQSLFGEEGIHAVARKLFKDEVVAGLWNSLTKAERALVETSYFGKERAIARPRYTDAQMGHEYLRRSMQRLLRMDLREVAELRGQKGAFREQIIDMAERVIQAVRRMLKTEPSKTLDAMLRDMQRKVDVARGAKLEAAGPAPAGFYKLREIDPTDIDEIRFTVQPNEVHPDTGEWIPSGYVQIDGFSKGRNVFSSNPEDMRAAGYQVPTREMLAALPRGQYSHYDVAPGALPAKGMVRLYHGEGGAEGAGMGSLWWTANPRRAASFGENVSYVDVPKEVFDKGAEAVKKTGRYTKGDAILPDEWILKGKPTVAKVATEVFDTDLIEREKAPAAFAKDAESRKWLRDFNETTKRLEILWGQAYNQPWARDVLFGNVSAKTVAQFPELARRLYRASRDMEALKDSKHFNDYEKFIGVAPSHYEWLPTGELGRVDPIAGEGQPQIGPGVEPGAFAKKKPVEGPELPLAPMTAGQVRQGVDLPRASFTPGALIDATVKHLTEAPRPNFATFLEELKQKLPEVKPGEVRDLWESQVWKRLLGASAAELERLGKTMGLQKVMPRGRIAEPRPDDVPEMLKGPPPPVIGQQILPIKGATPESLKPVIGRIAPPDVKIAPEVAAERNRRFEAIATLGQKLIRESQEGRKAWRRTEITGDDLANPRVETKQPVYQSFTSEDAKTPDELGAALTADARAFGGAKITKSAGGKKISITQKGLPVSVTKRVTVIQNKETGRVHVVSTFRDGRRGPVLLDPMAPKGTHSALDSILNRYRVISSMLLDEPVQNFRQNFKDLMEFERNLGSEVRDAAYRLAGYEPPKARPEGAEGEIVPRGTGKGMIPGVFVDRPGTLETTEAITDVEARSIIDHIMGEVGEFNSPQDVKVALEAFAPVKTGPSKVRPTKLRETLESLPGVVNRPALSGLRKIGNRISEDNPDLTQEQFLDKLANQIYDDWKEAKTTEDFLAKAMERGSPTPSPVTGLETVPPAGAQVQTGARELTLPRFARRVSGPLPKGPGPVPKMPAPTPTRTLSPADAAYVKEQVAKMEGVRLPAVIYRQLAHRTVPRTKYTMGKPEAAKFEEPPEDVTPAAFAKVKEAAQERWEMVRKAITLAAARRSTKTQIAEMLDGADGTSAQFAAQSGNEVRNASKNVKVREAAVALVVSGEIEKPGSLFEGQWLPNPRHLPTLFEKLNAGELRANQWLLEGGIIKRHYAKKWLKAIERMREGLRYAQDHWNDPELQDVAFAVRKQLKETLEWENANGSSTQEREGFYPGRYEGGFWSDVGVTFGPNRLLGAQFRMPKKFKNVYEAIAHGPFIQASFDPAEVVEHRVRQGHRIIERKLWQDALMGMRDPGTREPIAKEPTRFTVEVRDPRTNEVSEEVRYKSPSLEYELVRPFGWQKPIAVRRGFAAMVNSVAANSHVAEMPVAKEALILASQLKHGVILIADTFHPARVAQYAAALLGLGKVGFKGGYAALSFTPEGLPDAVRQGYITQAQADWATAPVEVTVMRRQLRPTGSVVVPERILMTRQQILKEFISKGLNAAKISDALYRDAVQNIPFIGEGWHKLIGPYNTWLFGRFMPGLIAETAVRNLERYNKAHPNIPLNRLMRDVLRDTNVFYGNMGRQGIFRNATFRDLAQIFLLAPLWQEGLIQKEVRFASRLTGISHLTGRAGLPYLGTLGRGMANGLLTYFALTQLVNLVTRQQFTWQNEEEGHKLDAWIPTGESNGFWLSPLSVFGEVTHDIIRLGETKPTVFDAIEQMGANRAGPVGKMLYVFVKGKTPLGEQYTTSKARLWGGVSQVVPFAGPGPISFAGPARVAAHAMFPERVRPAPRGTLIRQGLASLGGMKVQPSDTAVQMISRMAERFVKEKGLKKSTGWIQVQTDEASYSKLRSAVRNDDPVALKENYEALLKDHTPLEIMKAVRMWSRRGFTGSKRAENEFLASLDDAGLELYTRANMEKQQVKEKFEEWLIKQPEPQPAP